MHESTCSNALPDTSAGAHLQSRSLHCPAISYLAFCEANLQLFLLEREHLLHFLQPSE